MQRTVVIPGQVIAVSSDADQDGGFLRGHGTYVETLNGGDTTRLVSSVLGTVERVNKLISVIPSASPNFYAGQVGDLVIGRISSVGSSRWTVQLCSRPGRQREAQLPLSGVNLPGGVQRIRTSADALRMRSLFCEGDLLGAEIQDVRSLGSSGGGGSGGGGGATGKNAAAKSSAIASISGSGSGSEMLLLHTRSMRYGKLENGILVFVPPVLIGRMKQHVVTLGKRSSTSSSSSGREGVGNNFDDNDGFDGVAITIWIGCNGGIWIQRALPPASTMGDNDSDDDDNMATAAETLQALKKTHARTSVLPHERLVLARVRNAIDALSMVHCRITPMNVSGVVQSACKMCGRDVGRMLQPDVVVEITRCTREQGRRTGG